MTPAPVQAQILVADDEAPIRITMEALLRRRGYAVTTVDSGEAALALIHQRPWDLLLLDLKMSGMSGLDVAQRARQLQPEVAIVILTGHGSLDSAMAGIQVGIFDYLLKTSSPQEVLQRVEAALAQQTAARRQQRVMQALAGVVTELQGTQPVVPQPESSTNWLVAGDLHISSWNQTVRRGDQQLTLTPTEFRVLSCLAQQAGQVMTFVEIVQCAQGYAVSASEAAEMVKPHIHHLRQKLEPDPASPRYILTVRGTGYLLVAHLPTAP